MGKSFFYPETINSLETNILFRRTNGEQKDFCLWKIIFSFETCFLWGGLCFEGQCVST